MIPESVRDKLIRYFNEDKYEIVASGQKITLEEKAKDGAACVTCTFKKDGIVFYDPEHNVLRYLDEKKPGATKCADKIIFLFDEDGTADLRIIEFKKTINSSTMSDEKKQFEMGIYNARSISGFLNFDICNIGIGSGFRKDKITSITEDTMIAMRRANNTEVLRLIKEWKKDSWKVSLDGKEIPLNHVKIPLDESGYGVLAI